MREDMIAVRRAKGLTTAQMAKKCECSELLLRMIEEEDGSITHPEIAARIARAYGMTADGYNGIVHKSRRRTELPKVTKRKRKGVCAALREGGGNTGGWRAEQKKNGGYDRDSNKY